MLCCAVDSSPLITGGCPEKSLPAGGICACAKWTWNMPCWITEGPSAPLAVPLHDNPRERKRGTEEKGKWGKSRNKGYLLLNSNSHLLGPVSHLLLILFSFSLSVSLFLSVSLPLRSLHLPQPGAGSYNWWEEKKKQTIQPTPCKCEIRLELRALETD